MYETLSRLAWKGVFNWLEEHHSIDIKPLEETLKKIAVFRDNVFQSTLLKLLEHESGTHILNLFQVHLQSLRSGYSLSTFWMSSKDMNDIM